jgi:hypothetical protein
MRATFKRVFCQRTPFTHHSVRIRYPLKSPYWTCTGFNSDTKNNRITATFSQPRETARGSVVIKNRLKPAKASWGFDFQAYASSIVTPPPLRIDPLTQGKRTNKHLRKIQCSIEDQTVTPHNLQSAATLSRRTRRIMCVYWSSSNEFQ